MPKLDLQNTNITIAGSWNVAILSPQWIQTQFPSFKTGENIPLEIAINMRDIRYEIKNLVINPSLNKLVISPKNDMKECFDSLVELTAGIVERLIHTPIMAVGSNFAYSLDKNEEIDFIYNEVEKLDQYYNKIGKKFSGNFSTQHVLVEKDKQITVFYNVSPSTRNVSFNYNQNTNNKENVIDFIKEFDNQKNDAYNILRNLLRKNND